MNSKNTHTPLAELKAEVPPRPTLRVGSPKGGSGGIEDFDYALPHGLIAQYPLVRRDASRLMVVHSGAIEHGNFLDIIKYLKKGDVIIFNDTKVLSARLLGKKHSGGKVELLLISGSGRDWLCMVKPEKGIKKGSRVFFEQGFSATAVTKDLTGLWRFQFSCPALEYAEKFGKIPLPPYIKRPAEDIDSTRYQTVFASNVGAVAAPTAGLHFTEEILEELKDKGVEVRYITLHTGPATFLPVRDISRHNVIGEFFSISKDTFEAIKRAKRETRKIFAVGSTVTRAVETVFMNPPHPTLSPLGRGEKKLKGCENPSLNGTTNLFVRPGFEFKVVDALITNFHLPRSSLIMLVAAFAGRDLMMNAYKEAVRERYRFYSYGDCMLIV